MWARASSTRIEHTGSTYQVEQQVGEHYVFVSKRGEQEVLQTTVDPGITELVHTCACFGIHCIQESQYNHMQGVFDQNSTEFVQ